MPNSCFMRPAGRHRRDMHDEAHTRFAAIPVPRSPRQLADPVGAGAGRSAGCGAGLRHQGAARHPDGRRQRHGPVRESRRRADAAGLHGQADADRIRLPRPQGRPPVARRRVRHLRTCVADGRRQFGRLRHVRQAELQRAPGAISCAASSSSRATTLRSPWPKGSRGPNSPSPIS